MLLAVFYILLKIVYCPYILFMGSIFLSVLATSSHPFLQGYPQLVSFLGVVLFWADMVIIVGTSMGPAVVILLVCTLLLVGCMFLRYWFLGVHMIL